MDMIGELDNVVIQQRAVRTVHGWLDLNFHCYYLAIRPPGAPYLFRLIYDYPRADVATKISTGRGILAEIMYDTDDITARLIHSDAPEVGVVYAVDLAPLGRVHCADTVLRALSGPLRPR